MRPLYSRLAKAVTYAKNQKPYMENYLLDGRCSISNNIAENIARPYAVGRKNFLFHDTVKGARASSIIYSLVETAKLNNLTSTHIWRPYCSICRTTKMSPKG